MAILERRDFIRRCFLEKEIVSKNGEVHFRRYRLLKTPWFALYVHNILKSDEDMHPHDHPWAFVSIILWGAYLEEWLRACYDKLYRQDRHSLLIDRRSPGSVIYHAPKDFHKLTLLTPSVWSLVFTWNRNRPSWGYQTEKGWIDHKTYRQLKNDGKL